MTDFFEDIGIGDELVLGEFTFTKEDIIRFAQSYDPQPFHLSEEAAAETHFGKLCASGWHTAAVFMKLLVAKMKALETEALAQGRTPAKVGPSPGFENLKWIKPVYVGDKLRYKRIVTGKTESRSRPDWGLVHSDMLAHIIRMETLVFSFRATVFHRTESRLRHQSAAGLEHVTRASRANSTSSRGSRYRSHRAGGLPGFNSRSAIDDTLCAIFSSRKPATLVETETHQGCR